MHDRRHTYRLTAILALAAAAALLLSSCAGALNFIEDRLPPPHEVDGGILFRYYAPSARQVTLAGGFNNWGGTQGGGRYDPAIDPMRDDDGDGVWETVVPLPPGRYQYKFVIDGGVRWEMDPSNLDTDFDAGIENSLIIVPSTIRYEPSRITGTTIGGEEKPVRRAATRAEAGLTTVVIEFDSADAGSVFIAGEFNAWSPDADEMTRGEDGVFRVTLELEPGTYEYKFVVDGTWVEDPANPDGVDDPYGGRNSLLTVE